jgi:hypothetical protein
MSAVAEALVLQVKQVQTVESREDWNHTASTRVGGHCALCNDGVESDAILQVVGCGSDASQTAERIRCVFVEV